MIHYQDNASDSPFCIALGGISGRLKGLLLSLLLGSSVIMWLFIDFPFPVGDCYTPLC